MPLGWRHNRRDCPLRSGCRRRDVLLRFSDGPLRSGCRRRDVLLRFSDRPLLSGCRRRDVLLRFGDRPLSSGCRRRDVLLCGCQRTAGTLRCVGRPVVSAARPAVPSGELQPAVDAERRCHRVHPPRCLSLPLSNTQGLRGVGKSSRSYRLYQGKLAHFRPVQAPVK